MGSPSFAVRIVFRPSDIRYERFFPNMFSAYTLPQNKTGCDKQTQKPA